eukprot:CAMPEP_0201712690 /NCGR_PEP_ID=MMETSP0578-20130828/59771_1 /ASSEMBLY_ACC=CAM_ASM_000663 /TAXON_ID=267565 /ORGANISM="Skeletonema grethea, Strain CCMP 1804" /LENGTH=654 /DNA_ID=CAMNT_0048201753 /DNA_START=24 /DNA_END=1988 /DNA_ORIENTATION=+
MDAYSIDRRYDDASVPGTVNSNFDAETINFGADSVNFDAETVEFDAPVFDPPLHQDFVEEEEEEDEEFHQLNYRQGKWKYVVISFFVLVAACALAVSLTLYFERAKDSSVSPVIKVDAATNVARPTLQPSIFRASSEECVSGGRCSEAGSTCAIGEETCCGETYDSIVCDCTGGQWLCRTTDACNRPDCEDIISAAPSSNPSLSSSDVQTESPTITIQTPQAKPTPVPSKKPSTSPSFTPTTLPTNQPSQSPTPNPVQPTKAPVYRTYQPTADTSSTLSPSNKPTLAPSSQPSKKPTLKPSLRPSSQPTSSPSLSPSSSQPTSKPSARPTSQPTSKPSFSLSPSYQPTFQPSLQPSKERKYCVNIKFTTDNYPRDNGFTFLSKETGQVIYEQQTGSMTVPQTTYMSQFCDLSAGSYELVVTDTIGDGMTIRGNGSYVVDIDGQVILVGGRFNQMTEISHEIIVGFDANSMSETEQGFLDAHNERRKDFHESQNVSYRPMAWSAELAAGASAWAREKAKTCSNDNKESGPFGQNASAQRLNSPDAALNPDETIASWMSRFDPDEPTWSNFLKPGGALLWRSALYVGCASEVARIEDRDEYCQVTNCRYARTPNCAVNSNDNWVDSVLDENGHMCDTVFCPGADENGKIVEGACHA